MKAKDSKYCRCLYFASGALARKVEKLAMASWSRSGLSPSVGYLLMLVIDEPGIQPTALTEQLQLSPSTITRLIDRLERMGLVLRVSHGKLTGVYATPQGKAKEDELKDCLKEFYTTYVKILGKDESAAFVVQMNKMTDQLDI